MDLWGPGSTGGIDTSTYIDLDSIKCEDFDLVDPQMSDKQKPTALGPRVDVLSNSDPFYSSGSTYSETPSNTIYGTTIYPPFPLPINTIGSLGSSGYSSIDSTTQNISSISSPTKSSLSTPPLSTSSTGRATTSTAATARPRTESAAVGKRKWERLNHLTDEQKNFRRKEKNRLTAQAARERAKAKQSDLKLTVARLTSENAQLQSKLQAMEFELELVKSTRSVSNTCAHCDHLHQQQEHDSSNRDNNLVSSGMAHNWFGSSELM